MNRAGRRGGDAGRPAGGAKRSRTRRAAGRPRPRRTALVVGFALGLAFGLALGAVAYFLDIGAVRGGALANVIRPVDHPDIVEDAVWFLSGAFIGGMIAAYAAWRADRSRADGIGREHVLHRTFRVLEGGAAARTRPEPPRDGESGGADRS